MKTKHFLDKMEHGRLLNAIQAAEAGSTGDIVILIKHYCVSDPLIAAHKAYKKLRLGSAPDENSLLFFFAPAAQKFAIVGGRALHEKVGQIWWDELSAILSSHFKEERFTDGLIAALEKSGEALRTHFPAKTPLNRADQKDIVEE